MLPKSPQALFIAQHLEAGRWADGASSEKLNGKGNVVFFTISGQPNTEERLKGFKDVFASKPDIRSWMWWISRAMARAAFDKDSGADGADWT